MCFVYFLIFIPAVVIASSRQCLRYQHNDLILNTCPFTFDQPTIDFSAALFPDSSVLSVLGHEHIQSNDKIQQQQQQQKKQQKKTSRKSKKRKHTTTSATASPITLNSHTKKSTTKKPLVSFEEWQRKQGEQEERTWHKRKGSDAHSNSNNNNNNNNKKPQQQIVDSIDGGFGDDFGAMFEGILKAKEDVPNANIIEPMKTKQEQQDQPKVVFIDNNKRMKSLKERFNYASNDCAATVRKSNKEAKGANAILYESKDQYMINKCKAEKFVIINLCEPIRIDTIVMANFEFFSSTFKDFRVYVADRYPSDDWQLLGQWRARNTRDLQVFRVEDRSGWPEYMKIEFLSHYGNEYYCPLSLVRVYGMSMMEYYNRVERQGLSEDDGVVLGDEHLWPSEIREQIIQPQLNVVNTSESFPVKHDQDDDHHVEYAIPPIKSDSLAQIELTNPEEEEQEEEIEYDEEYEEDKIVRDVLPPEDPIQGQDVRTTIDEAALNESLDKLKEDMEAILTPSVTPSMDHQISTPNTFTSSQNMSTTENNSSLNVTIANNNATNDASVDSRTLSNTNVNGDDQKKEEEEEELNHTSTMIALEETRAPSNIAINHHPKEKTQESIYKTIMKRLNALELNATLSKRYLDDQNEMLNQVFLDMERKHQEQLIFLIGQLNETASYKIESMKKRYEQWYEDLKHQTETDMREMTAKIGILADQLSFERRVSVSQLVITITIFVFMALSRGTFNALSPIMAAQQKERRRREAIDQSAVLLNAVKRSLRPQQKQTPSNEIKTSLLTPSVLQPQPSSSPPPPPPPLFNLNTTPATSTNANANTKKPSNPRRHSDNPYYLMNLHQNSGTSSPIKKSKYVSKYPSYEALGIDVQNNNIFNFDGAIFDRKSQSEEQSKEEKEETVNKEEEYDGIRKRILKNEKFLDSSSNIPRKRSNTSPPPLTLK